MPTESSGVLGHSGASRRTSSSWQANSVKPMPAAASHRGHRCAWLAIGSNATVAAAHSSNSPGTHAGRATRSSSQEASPRATSPAPPRLTISGVMPLVGMASRWAYMPSQSAQHENTSPTMASMAASSQGGCWFTWVGPSRGSTLSGRSSGGIQTRTSNARKSATGTQVGNAACQPR